MIRNVLLGSLIALGAAGCASQPCQQNLAYQHAATTQPLTAPPGLNIPHPSSEYQIPTVQGKS